MIRHPAGRGPAGSSNPGAGARKRAAAPGCVRSQTKRHALWPRPWPPSAPWILSGGVNRIGRVRTLPIRLTPKSGGDPTRGAPSRTTAAQVPCPVRNSGAKRRSQARGPIHEHLPRPAACVPRIGAGRRGTPLPGLGPAPARRDRPPPSMAGSAGSVKASRRETGSGRRHPKSTSPPSLVLTQASACGMHVDPEKVFAALPWYYRDAMVARWRRRDEDSQHQGPR